MLMHSCIHALHSGAPLTRSAGMLLIPHAQEACDTALDVAPKDFDKTKIWFRRGTAWERLGSLEEAYKDMRKALDVYGEMIVDEVPGANSEQLKKLSTETKRLKMLWEEEAAKKEVVRREAEIEKAREGLQAEGQAVGSAPLVRGAGYVQDTDFTHWFHTTAKSKLEGKSVSAGKWPTVNVMSISKIDGHANVINKRNQCSLYYSLDVTCDWVCEQKEGCSRVQGVIRLYNISQDTTFRLGGGESTSYMYQLGYNPNMDKSMIDDVIDMGGDLFEKLVEVVEEIIAELTSKSENKAKEFAEEMAAAEPKRSNTAAAIPRGFFDKGPKTGGKTKKSDEAPKPRAESKLKKSGGFARGFLSK